MNFRRNYGQTPAMAAGIEQAHGKVLITMDGDLQNDPRDIEQFLAKINEGYDIVVGWRFNRQDKLVSRKIPSKIANWLIGKAAVSSTLFQTNNAAVFVATKSTSSACSPEVASTT